MEQNPTIVIPAFKRPKSLKRLLDSIGKSMQLSGGNNILITLDGGHASEVFDVANKFKKETGGWSIEIIKQKENMGLKEHVLWCGNQCSRTGSIILLEDDILVDRQFLRYSKSALKFYKNEKKISGISLYSQMYNEFARLPFHPIESNFSNYFMRHPCSWGQLWTADQWHEFYSWYKKEDDNSIKKIEMLPDTVKNWPTSSWKKFFAAYMIDRKKLFVYPYKSYTTNCSDPDGHHIPKGTNIFQVPLSLQERSKDEFKFMDLNKKSIIYDSYLEPASDFIYKKIGIEKSELEIDIYGIKPIEKIKNKKYCLTTKKCSRKISSYPLKFRPIEINFDMEDIHGEVSLCETKHIEDIQGQSREKMKSIFYY